MTEQPPSSPPLNRYQIAAAQEYAGGDFSWIINEACWRKSLSDIQDHHLIFIMTELSLEEGCENQTTALHRLQTAANEIQTVYDAIEELPDHAPDAAPHDKRIIATFVPQIWINRHAVTAAPLGETRIDITEAVLAMTRDEALALRDDTDETDLFRHIPGAPDWIDHWSGPFYVAVEAAIADYFDLLQEPEVQQTT